MLRTLLIVVTLGLLACSPDIDPPKEPNLSNTPIFDTVWSVFGHPERQSEIRYFHEPQVYKGRAVVISNSILFDQRSVTTVLTGDSGLILNQYPLLAQNEDPEPPMIVRHGRYALASTYKGWNAIDLESGEPVWSIDRAHHFLNRENSNRATAYDGSFFFFEEGRSFWEIYSTPVDSYEPRLIFSSSSSSEIDSIDPYLRGMTIAPRPSGGLTCVVYGDGPERHNAFVCFIDVKTGEIEHFETFPGAMSRDQEAHVRNGRIFLPMFTEIRAYNLSNLEYEWSRYISRSWHVEFIPVEDRLIIYTSAPTTGPQAFGWS